MSPRQKIILIILLIFGTLVQVTPIIRSGWLYSYGIGFWGPSGHDQVWHLSLINTIKNPFHIELPIFSGEKLLNYHPFFNILIAGLAYLTHISPSFWLFQLFPALSSLTLLYLSFYFGRLVTQKYSGGIILLLLNSLANSLGWVVTFIRSGNFSGESLFWAMQSPSNQINPPYTLSLVFILILLILIFQQSRRYFLVFLILSLLPITKAYSSLVGFSLYGLYSIRALFNYRQIKPLLVLLASLFTAGYLFWLYNPSSSNLLVFKPFWFISSMIDSPDKLFLPKVSSLRFTLESYRSHDIRLPLIYLGSFAIFIVGNYGFRLLGFFQKSKLPRLINFGLILNIVILTFIPTFFIQKGTSWNTIQFLYYALFLSNIYLAAFLVSHRFLTIIIFTTYLLAFWGTLPNYFGGAPPAALPNTEVKALNFLRLQPSGNVLTYPYDSFIKHQYPTTPIPLYAYETTAYVSAYSQHHTYLEDEMNLNNSGYNFQARRQQSLLFFEQTNPISDRGFLVNNQIDYIYLTGFQVAKVNLSLDKLSLVPIYQQDGTIIYRVRR